MKTHILILLALIPAMTMAQSEQPFLFDQSQFVTEPGAFNGYDVSRLHSDHVAFGPGINFEYGYMLADDFTLGETVRLTELEVYGYQSYSPTTSTFTGLYFVIYDGNPMDGGQVIWGDPATNRMTATAWTQCYRCGHSGSNPTNDERPIMSVTATGFDVELEPGTYYIAWGLTGTGEYGPYGIPVTIAGQAVTGDALQYDGDGLWRELYMDQNYACPAGAAFLLRGTVVKPSVGVADAAKPDFGLFPNPANATARVTAEGMTHVTVTDLSGRVVFDAAVDADTFDLPTARFGAGVYAVRVATPDGTSTRRLTVIK